MVYWVRVLVCACCLWGAQTVWAHPDLIIQIDALSAQLHESPDNTELLLRRGDLYRRHQDYDSAAQDYARVEAIDPDAELLDYYQGRLQMDIGQPDQADLLLERYLQRNPDHAKAWKLQGEVKLARNMPALAATRFDQAIFLSDSPSPELYRLVILSLLASGEANWPKAMERVDEGLDRFDLEVTILGLGIDMALAGAQADQARGWMNRLPPRLARLPQWTERQKVLDCLSGDSGMACQDQAMEALQKQVDEFMQSHQ